MIFVFYLNFSFLILDNKSTENRGIYKGKNSSPLKTSLTWTLSHINHGKWEIIQFPLVTELTTFIGLLSSFYFFCTLIIIKLIKCFEFFYPFLFKKYFLLSYLNLIVFLRLWCQSKHKVWRVRNDNLCSCDSVKSCCSSLLQVISICDWIFVHFRFVFYIAFLHGKWYFDY